MVPRLINYSSCAADPVKKGGMQHVRSREICRDDCLAGTVHMEICSHFFLCAIPFTNGNDCFVASSHYISLP